MDYKTFHKGKYYVTFKRGFEDCKKNITVTIDKVFESDCLRISLSDDEDPTFLSVITVNRCDYEDLKKQQGLLIDFDNFPGQVVRLLQQCASNNMFLIMQQNNPIQFYFEIIEHNEFKRLVHLSLRTGPAADSDIKQHMAETINNLKKTLSAIKSSSNSTEAILNDKCVNMERKIQDLSHAITKMEEDRLRRETEYQESIKQERDRLTQERLQWQKNSELNFKSQQTTAFENLNRKEKQIDELNQVIRQLRDTITQLENQISEKNQRLNVLEAEVPKSHIEVATLKAKNAVLDREITEKEKQYNHINSRCTYLDKALKENSDTIKDLNNALQIARKEKASLEERLAISDSLVKKNSDAAYSTSEQLMKANQIISKQNSDLIEMKEKLLCRTAIALEQEKVIERKTKDMEELKTEIVELKQSMEKITNELDIVKEKCAENEKALKDKDETIKNNNLVIQWLHKKMEDNCVQTDFVHKNNHGMPATSSTPYFLSRNRTNSTEMISEESINFYATTKSSHLEDSPQVGHRVGLDPKYLQPATDNSKEKITKETTKSTEVQKGKENKNVKLPKVDYREKKTSKGSTYRATPVSAYFP